MTYQWLGIGSVCGGSRGATESQTVRDSRMQEKSWLESIVLEVGGSRYLMDCEGREGAKGLRPVSVSKS